MLSSYHTAFYSVGYLAFFTLLWISKRYRGNRLLDEKGLVANCSVLLLLHIAGIVLMGMVCVPFADQSPLEIIAGKNPADRLPLLITAIIVIAAFLLAITTARKKYVHFSMSRNMRVPFSRVFVIHYFVVRIVFLVVYEIWFRGYLLSDCINSMGIPLAILVNTCLYCLLHIVNGKQEVNACIPIGLLFCGLCIWTGAAWPAILIHLVMAVSHELYLVKKINKTSISFI